MSGNGGDNDDPSQAYRRPAPNSAPEIESPVTWRKPSSKVLGALARLNDARTGVASSGPTEPAAETRARVLGDVNRHLPRCVDGHELFVAGDFVGAAQRYDTWQARAKTRAHDDLDRLEVLVMLAVLRRWDRQRITSEVALREALGFPMVRYREDAPFEGALTLAGTMRDLGMRRASRALLSTRTAATPEQEAQLLRARADDALAHREEEQALALANAALSAWNRLVESSSREHIATRLTIARAHLLAKRWTTADQQLRLILRSADRSVDLGLTARAWSTAAELLFAQGSSPEAALASASYQAEATWDGPFAAKAPILRTRAWIYAALGRDRAAERARDFLAEIERQHPACLMPELR